MDLTSSTRDGATVLTLTGRIDHATADQLQSALEPYVAQCREGEPLVVLDMSGVDYISSVGLRALMVAAKQVQSQLGRIVVANLSPMVKEVFEISRFDLVFDVFETVAEALAARDGGSG